MMTRYIESLIYQAVVENAASEQAARMVAMKAASDNAGGLIDELVLAYNKARQASITQGAVRDRGRSGGAVNLPPFAVSVPGTPVHTQAGRPRRESDGEPGVARRRFFDANT